MLSPLLRMIQGKVLNEPSVHTRVKFSFHALVLLVCFLCVLLCVLGFFKRGHASPLGLFRVDTEAALKAQVRCFAPLLLVGDRSVWKPLPRVPCSHREL